MRIMEEKVVLCGASSYEQKYYFNQQFSALPESIRQELQIMCVLYTEDVGGILTMEFDREGNLEFRVEADEGDYLFDDIGSALKIKQYQLEKRELLESLGYNQFEKNKNWNYRITESTDSSSHGRGNRPSLPLAVQRAWM